MIYFLMYFCILFTFMHLADISIQSDLYCIQGVHAFPRNQTHDLGVASSMLYCLSSENAIFILKPESYTSMSLKKSWLNGNRHRSGLYILWSYIQVQWKIEKGRNMGLSFSCYFEMWAMNSKNRGRSECEL